MQEVQGKCAVHISLREASVGGLEDMVLSEAEDGEEGDGELIEKDKERQEAMDEVEVLPDDEDEHQAGRTTPTAHAAVIEHRSELLGDDDDGEIVNLPTPSIA